MDEDAEIYSDELLTRAQGQDRMDKILDELAARCGEMKSAVIRRAVALLSHIEDAVAEGARVFIRGPHGEKEIVFPER